MLSKEQKKCFSNDGYLIIDTHLSESVLDKAIASLSPYFGENREHPIHVPYADPRRVQDAWHICQSVLKIAQCSEVINTLEDLYEKQARPFQTLNFHTGTEQAVHADSIHFNSEPFGAMCGVWVALEDVGLEQGPLVYHPGSNKLPEMNYDYFNIEPSQANYGLYLQALKRLVKENNFNTKHAVLKKGQALIWAANTIHGGAKQSNKELTRHSQVTHYYLGDVKAWRPSFSAQSRFYFKPEWVRDVSGEPYKYPIPDAKFPPLPIRVLNRLKRALNKTPLAGA